MGNICRSPTAAGTLIHLLQREAPQLSVQVSSAGTSGYHVGEAPDPRSVRAALARGVDLSGMYARRLEREDFREFALILPRDQDNMRVLLARRPNDAKARIRLFMEYAPQCGA